MQNNLDHVIVITDNTRVKANTNPMHADNMFYHTLSIQEHPKYKEMLDAKAGYRLQSVMSRNVGKPYLKDKEYQDVQIVWTFTNYPELTYTK